MVTKGEKILKYSEMQCSERHLNSKENEIEIKRGKILKKDQRK